MPKRVATADDDTVAPPSRSVADYAARLGPENESMLSRLATLVKVARKFPRATPDELAALFVGAAQYAGHTLAVLSLHNSRCGTTWHGYALFDAREWPHFERIYVLGGGELCLGDAFGKHSDVHAAWKDFDTAAVYTDPARIAVEVARADGGGWDMLDCESHYTMDDEWMAAIGMD